MEVRPRRWPDLLIGLLVLLLLAGFAALLVGQRPSPLAQSASSSGQITPPDRAVAEPGQTNPADIPGAPGTDLVAQTATQPTVQPTAQQDSTAQTKPDVASGASTAEKGTQKQPDLASGTPATSGTQPDAIQADTATPPGAETKTDQGVTPATSVKEATKEVPAPVQTKTPQTEPVQAAPAAVDTSKPQTPDAPKTASATTTRPDTTKQADNTLPVVAADPIPAAPVDPPVAPPPPLNPPVEAKTTPAPTKPAQPAPTGSASAVPQPRPEQAQPTPSQPTQTPQAEASTPPAASPRTGTAVPTSEQRTPLRSDFRISLGTFGSTAEVERSTARVQGQGYTVYPIEVGGQVVAQIGPFADEETARRALADIEGTAPGALLYRPRGYRADSGTETSTGSNGDTQKEDTEQKADSGPSRAAEPQAADTRKTTEKVPAPSGPVYLQVGAFDRVESAQRLVGMLRDEGYASTVNAPEDGKVTVLIGPFSGDAVTRAEANLDENDFDHFRIR